MVEEDLKKMDLFHPVPLQTMENQDVGRRVLIVFVQKSLPLLVQIIRFHLVSALRLLVLLREIFHHIHHVVEVGFQSGQSASFLIQLVDKLFDCFFQSLHSRRLRSGRHGLATAGRYCRF